ncbi:hypothetical protein K7432_005815 [Basidiobolus ranarum]|uniref:Uncharacterized protein n=1 Tax=Basidiobolus ranarum TaxID=34480 RepID=A0ABR2W2N0_9FUNG
MLNSKLVNHISSLNKEQLELLVLKACSRHSDISKIASFVQENDVERNPQISSDFERLIYWYECLGGRGRELNVEQRFYLLTSLTLSITRFAKQFDLTSTDPRHYLIWIWESPVQSYQIKRCRFSNMIGEKWKSLLQNHARLLASDLGYSASDWKRLFSLVVEWEDKLISVGVTLGSTKEILRCIEQQVIELRGAIYNKTSDDSASISTITSDSFSGISI